MAPTITRCMPSKRAAYGSRTSAIWDLACRMEELQPFVGHCDVLMAIIGEKLTVKLDDLEPMIDFLKPTWLIPMHYDLPPVAFGMSKIEKFLDRRKQDALYFPRSTTVTFPLPKSEHGGPTIVVMETSGYSSIW